MKLAPKINKALDDIADQMIGSSNSATHRKLIQDAFRQFSVKVYVAVDEAVSKKKDMVVVTGAYSPWRVRQNIEIVLNYAPAGRRVKLTKKLWKALRFDLSQVLQHELVHRRQCAHIEIPSEDWSDHNCKVSVSYTHLTLPTKA